MAIVNNRESAKKPNLAALRLADQATLGGQIADRLRESIRAGLLPAGTRLTETSIAAQTQTSRGPIREALRQLSEAGLVELRPHRGAVVTERTEDEFADMIYVRAVLEGNAARSIARKRDKLDFTSIEAIVENMRLAARPSLMPQLRDLDFQFHREVMRLSGSAYSLKFWSMMHDGLSLVIIGAIDLYKQLDAVPESHAAMLEVLRTKTPAEAESYFRKRILETNFRALGRPTPDE
jgi:DNA-binding GntR family transcriptional regulator